MRTHTISPFTTTRSPSSYRAYFTTSHHIIYTISTTAIIMLPSPLGTKVLIAILALLASDIGVSYNGIGRHSSELRACFFGAANFYTCNVEEAVMARLVGPNADTNRFKDEASQQNINLMTNLMANLSPASQQWLYVALSQGEKPCAKALVQALVFPFTL